jgi:hypothetical protein
MRLRSSTTRFLGPLCAALLISTAACGGDGNGSSAGEPDVVEDTGGGDGEADQGTGDGGTEDAGDDSAAEDASGSEETGGGDLHQDPHGGGDLGGETSEGDVMSTDPSGDVATGDCELSRDGITAGEGQALVLQSFNFEDDTVVLRNISDSAVAFDRDEESGQPSWRLYAESQANGRDLPAGFEIAAGGTVRIWLRSSGSNDGDNIYLNWATNLGANLAPDTGGDGGEIAILSPNDDNTDPSAIEAYARWGNDDPFGDGRSFRNEAAAAGTWSGNEDGDYIFVTESSIGATVIDDGDATDPAEWTNNRTNVGCF